MTQNPYAHNPMGPGGGGMGGDFEQYSGPRRTSILAIFSLVLALLCFIPGAGALAVICGGASMILIPKSRGRTGGMGLAITGTLVGLVITILWVMFLAGMSGISQQFGKGFLGPASTMMTAIDKGDYATARKTFTPALNAAVTDKQIAAFHDAYKAEVGSFQSMPQTLWQMILAYVKVGPAMKGMQGQQTPGEMPMPATFDKGMAIVLLMMPMNGASQPAPGQMLPPLDNIGVMTPAGKQIWLVPKPTWPPQSAPTPPPAPDKNGSGGSENPPPDGQTGN